MANEWATAIDSAVIERGLRELNADIHFDMGTKLGMWHPFQASRQGVYYHGKHICSMDRGPSPEFKIWSVAEREVQVPKSDWDKEDVKLRFEVISPTVPDYASRWLAAYSGKVDNEVIRSDGALLYLSGWRVQQTLGRVRWVGWRHTFERLLHAKIPGITRSSLAAEFKVDMLKFPTGPPEEVVAALVEE